MLPPRHARRQNPKRGPGEHIQETQEIEEREGCIYVRGGVEIELECGACANPMLHGHCAVSDLCKVDLPGGAEFHRIIAAQHEIMCLEDAVRHHFASAIDVSLPCDSQQYER